MCIQANSVTTSNFKKKTFFNGEEEVWLTIYLIETIVLLKMK